MELLTIEHKDFTMIVECTKFDGIWNKAKSNVGEDKLYSTYSWSDGVVSVKRTLDADHEIDIEQGVPAPATFFLTSSSCHPKIFVKEFSYFLMPCHQQCLGVNLLVQR